MSNATSNSFLSGRGVAVAPREIESQLDLLWGPAAEQVGGPELDQPSLTRIVLANLVVAGSVEADSRIDDVLDTVVARYPCRTIVLRSTNDPERRIDAEVSALCHLPAPGRPQVCSERIVLRAGPRARDLLPGAVRPLLEPDLPFVLWWTGDPRENEPLFRSLASECSRSIIGLPDPGGDSCGLELGLDAKLNRYAHDITWFGATLWRGHIAQFFDPSSQRPALDRIRSVQIETVSPKVGAPTRVAVWLAAWLAGQIGWNPLSVERIADGGINASFAHSSPEANPDQPISVTITTKVDPSVDFARLTSVTLIEERPGDCRSTYRLWRPEPGSQDLRCEVRCGDRSPLPNQVLAPELDTARRISAALESSRDDPPFKRALPIALWLLGVQSH